MRNREEIYNEVIQNHSELQHKYEGDKLQDEINKIVDEIWEDEYINSPLTYNQLEEWDKDDLINCILSYQEEYGK
tara:strand:+ start:794 stop:1018 length:225 start_codon:yes stop_codon:yes gene_type:complete